MTDNDGVTTHKPTVLLNSDQLELLRNFQVHSVGKDTLQAYWEWKHSEERIQTHLRYAQIFYQPQGSPHLSRSPHFQEASITQWQLAGLSEDTNYRVCIRVLKHNNVSSFSTSEDRLCADASTQLVHMRASIGSSVGAFLALAIIVVIVLLTQRRAALNRRNAANNERRSSSQKRSLWSSSSQGEVPCTLLDEEHVVCYDPDLNYYFCDIDPKCFDEVENQKAVLIPVYDDPDSLLMLNPKTVTFKDDGTEVAANRVISGGSFDSSPPPTDHELHPSTLIAAEIIEEGPPMASPESSDSDTTPGVTEAGLAVRGRTNVDVSVHRPNSPTSPDEAAS